MRRIRETLRLHLQAGLSYNEVGRTLKISKSVVGKYVSLARCAGVDWAIVQTLSDEELEARLYRPVPRASHQLAPDFSVVHQELKRAGVTLMLLWEEYAGSNPLAYKYTSFCIKYREFAKCQLRSMRQGHRRPDIFAAGGKRQDATAGRLQSFFARLECELIDRRSWKSFAEARMAIFTWIEGWYNPRRRHSGIGQKSPINFEKELQDKATATEPATAELPSEGR